MTNICSLLCFFYRISDLPDDGPIISGTHPMYNPGDILSANCTSYNSFPAATLNWYINGQVAPHRLLKKFPLASSKQELTTSTLGLRYCKNFKFVRRIIILLIFSD